MSRLPLYLNVLVDAAQSGTSTLSSDELASAAGLNSAKVRKDLSFLGSYGTRGVGYQVAELTDEISQVLGLTAERRTIIVGVGNLGAALASYGGFDRRGFEIAALLDADPAKIGTRVGAHVIEDVADIDRIVDVRGVTFAVLSTPGEHAQQAAERVVAAGVRAILNFAPIRLRLPDDVTVRTVDLSTELQILSFYEHMSKLTQAAAG